MGIKDAQPIPENPVAIVRKQLEDLLESPEKGVITFEEIAATRAHVQAFQEALIQARGTFFGNAFSMFGDGAHRVVVFRQPRIEKNQHDRTTDFYYLVVFSGLPISNELASNHPDNQGVMLLHINQNPALGHTLDTRRDEGLREILKAGDCTDATGQIGFYQQGFFPRQFALSDTYRVFQDLDYKDWEERPDSSLIAPISHHALASFDNSIVASLTG
jgi:hypothetical protein